MASLRFACSEWNHSLHAASASGSDNGSGLVVRSETQIWLDEEDWKDNAILLVFPSPQPFLLCCHFSDDSVCFCFFCRCLLSSLFWWSDRCSVVFWHSFAEFLRACSLFSACFHFSWWFCFCLHFCLMFSFQFYFGDQVAARLCSAIPLLMSRLAELPDRSNVTIAFPDEGEKERARKRGRKNKGKLMRERGRKTKIEVKKANQAASCSALPLLMSRLPEFPDRNNVTIAFSD